MNSERTQNIKTIVQVVITISLTIFDMVSDIILAVDYYKTGMDNWWFALTLLFFLLPLLPLILLLLMTFIGIIKLWTDRDPHPVSQGNAANEAKLHLKDIAPFYQLWKQFECVAASGPQLILQLYILALSIMGDTGSDRVTNLKNTTRISTNEVWDTTMLIDHGAYTTHGTFSLQTTEAKEKVTNINEKLTFVLQILVIISALLSMSWSSMNTRRVDEELVLENSGVVMFSEDFMLQDYILEMIWNMLCISSRIIVLALFASVQTYWFAGLISGQVVLFSSLFLCTILLHAGIHSKLYVFASILLSILLGINTIFNIFLPAKVYDIRLPYLLYAVYWIIMMVENTILITIWYHSTNELEMWYHVPAIVYVVIAYILSFILNTFHTSMKDYNYPTLGVRISHWEC